MKKAFTLAVTLLLCALMAVMTPLQAFAAASSTEYVSEVKIAYGDTLDAAEKWLTDNGYTPVSSDLNEGADSLLSSSRAVCLGYKTTKDPGEAITDMKVMNMKGNYSYEAYEMVLKDQAEQIAVFVSQLADALAEYRINYAAGLYKAIAAHDLLNKIYEDDTGAKMGDLLLNKTVQELGDEAYNALPGEEQAKHADMVKILMQGNSQVVLNIEQYLYIASDTSSGTFIDRLAETGSYDAFETAFAASEGITDGAALDKALAAEYDDTAILIAGGIASFRDLLAIYTGSELFGETDDSVVSAYFEEAGKAGDYLVWNNARSLYLSLSAVAYEDGTLYDFFTSDDYDLENEDRYMLYPLVASLSAGQRACVRYVNLGRLFDNGIMDDDGWKANYEKIRQQVIDESPDVSVYSGINRELFEGGVALTNAAKQLNESSDESFTDGFILDSITAPTYLLLAGFAVTAIASVSCRIAGTSLKSQLPDIVRSSLKNAHIVNEGANPPMFFTKLTEADVTRITEDMVSGNFSKEGLLILDTDRMEKAADISNKYMLLDNIGIYLNIAMLILALLTVASAWRDLYNYYHTEKTPIPRYMVDEVTDKDGNSTYTYYSAVTCNRLEGGFSGDDSKAMENYADLNGDVGKEWLALYVTKDASAGSPVKAEFICQKGKNSAGKNAPLTMFGEKSAMNLVDEKYAYDDEFGGIYLFWGTSGASLASTVSSTGTVAIIVAASVAAVAVIALLIARKKKKA